MMHELNGGIYDDLNHQVVFENGWTVHFIGPAAVVRDGDATIIFADPEDALKWVENPSGEGLGGVRLGGVPRN